MDKFELTCLETGKVRIVNIDGCYEIDDSGRRAASHRDIQKTPQDGRWMKTGGYKYRRLTNKGIEGRKES